jgi:hypothetical protein
MALWIAQLIGMAAPLLLVPIYIVIIPDCPPGCPAGFLRHKKRSRAGRPRFLVKYQRFA